MKRNKKIKKMSMSIEQKTFNIPYINFKDLEDLNEIITRLKNHYIKIIFRALKDVGADILLIARTFCKKLQIKNVHYCNYILYNVASSVYHLQTYILN